MPSSPTPPSQDVSHQALGLARLLDRACTRPGRYILILDIPDPRRHPWDVEIHHAGILRRQQLRRHPSR